MAMMLCVVGADIQAERTVVLGVDGKLYPAGEMVGQVVGQSTELCRKGFRAMVRDGEVREDDA